MKTKSFFIQFVVFIMISLLLTACRQEKQTEQIPFNPGPGDNAILTFGKNFYETAELFEKIYSDSSKINKNELDPNDIKGEHNSRHTTRTEHFAEGSNLSQIERLKHVYGSRLFPDGDSERAAREANEYADQYNNTDGQNLILPTFDPKWENLGPLGMPDKKSSKYLHGVGQMHRITFHPDYDGVSNTTLFASSYYGGLWKSLDDGKLWRNLNTDLLPFCSVADVCINPNNVNQIFICTGYADLGFAAAYGPNWSHANPVFTIGIYRSNDGGNSWKPINKGFTDGKIDGGTCRRMIINHHNPNQIFVATTRGIYICNNADARNPTWRIVLPANIAQDVEFRGLAIHPTKPNVSYASGRDIYRSLDYGENWHPLTGIMTNLDLNALPDGLVVKRINITVTPAAPKRLYAYIEGIKPHGSDYEDGCYIMMYNELSNQWQELDRRDNSGGTNLFSNAYLGIAVSPVNPERIYYGNTVVWGTENDRTTFSKRVSYRDSPGFHPDVHDLKFQPLKSGEPNLFCATHGGISLRNMNSGTWEYRCEGLSVATIWSFDDGNSNPNLALTGHQDCGTNIYEANSTGNKWYQVMTGDGYTARINDANNNMGFISAGDNSFKRLDILARHTDNEITKVLQDPYDLTRQYMRIPKTFPLVNHPVTDSMYFGFTEILHRLENFPTVITPRNKVWKFASNIRIHEPVECNRQLTEMVICKNNPKICYAVTGGVESDNLKSGLYMGTNRSPSANDLEFNFQRLTHPGEYVDNDTLAIITGLAVDPDDYKHFWITYTGYWDKFKVWETWDAGAHWTTADPHNELFNIPVNAIVYHKAVSNKYLYIGTDAGIYVWDPISLRWKKYGKFPNVRVTEMKINPSINKLRVATYGRGLWEGLLIP